MKEALSNYNIQYEIAVQWGDMDAAAHVNNLIYIKWTESARIHYFSKMEIDISFNQDNAGPILGYQDAKYTFPMTHPDTAIVGICVDSISNDRFNMHCAIFSKKHNRLACITNHTILPYNYSSLKKVTMPQQWITAIENIEQKKFEII